MKLEIHHIESLRPSPENLGLEDHTSSIQMSGSDEQLTTTYKAALHPFHYNLQNLTGGHPKPQHPLHRSIDTNDQGAMSSLQQHTKPHSTPFMLLRCSSAFLRMSNNLLLLSPPNRIGHTDSYYAVQYHAVQYHAVQYLGLTVRDTQPLQSITRSLPPVFKVNQSYNIRCSHSNQPTPSQIQKFQHTDHHYRVTNQPSNHPSAQSMSAAEFQLSGRSTTGHLLVLSGNSSLASVSILLQILLFTTPLLDHA